MLGVQTVDPDSRIPVRAAEFLADVAVDPTNGDLYAAWVDARFSSDAYNDVALAMSADGGHTWTDPVAVPRPILSATPALNRQALIPQVHVSADGRIAVSYYDFRNNDGADGDLETDYFVSQCRDANPFEPDLCAGAWTETRVTAARSTSDVRLCRGYADASSATTRA